MGTRIHCSSQEWLASRSNLFTVPLREHVLAGTWESHYEDGLVTRELSHSLCHERAVLPCWRFRTTRRGGSNSIHRREEHEAPVVLETVPPSIHIELRIVSEGEIELGGGGDPL